MESEGVGGCVEVSGPFGRAESGQAIDNSRLTTVVFYFLRQDLLIEKGIFLIKKVTTFDKFLLIDLTSPK